MTAGPEPADYALAPGVLSRRVDEEMVLLDMSSEQYYSLDGVGTDIVMRITSQPMVRALAELTRDYDVDADVLRTDVEQLIAELRDAGLLQHVHRDS